MNNEQNETDAFLDKELSELNKIIMSANELVGQLGGNPMAMLQQQFAGLQNQNKQQENPSPQKVQVINDAHTILYCVNKSSNPIPAFSSDGASGFDLRANLTVPILIKPMTMGFIPTGLYFEIEKGYEMQVRSRSGIAFKNQTFVLNSPGTVDCDYRGEVSIMLFNLGTTEIQVNHGDRVAQGVICPVMGFGRLTIMPSDTLTNTNRGGAGFGSTGVN